MTDLEKAESAKEFDPLDMNNYKIEKLPVREKSTFEKWMAILGGPLAIIVFISFGFIFEIPFLYNVEPDNLNKKALVEYNNPQKVFYHTNAADFPLDQKWNYESIETQVKSTKDTDEQELLVNFSEEEISLWDKLKMRAFGRKNSFRFSSEKVINRNNATTVSVI